MALFSLLLCIMAAALWLRSYFALDAVWFHPPHALYELITSNGRLEWYYSTEIAFIPQRRFGHRSDLPFDIGPLPPVAPGNHYFAGFGLMHVPHQGGSTTVVAVPLWSLFLIGAAGFWFSRRAWRRRYARQPHLCRQCGYDLRASRERCPECGTAIESGSAASHEVN